MNNTREKLIKLLYAPCESELEGQLGSCPDRKYGKCREVERLDYCAVNRLAEHLIAQGVVIPVRCKNCRSWVQNVENQKNYGTCYRGGFAKGIVKHENGYCERGVPLKQEG